MADRQHSPKIIARARKVYALIKSPEKNEAAVAKQRWQELVDKHGIKESDVAEDVIDVVDPEVDPFREWLGALVATLRGCVLAIHKTQGLGFKGPTERVKAAKDLYLKIIGEAEAFSMSTVIAPWFQESARDIYVYYWKASFIDRMNERCPKRAKPVATPVVKSEPVVDPYDDGWDEPVRGKPGAPTAFEQAKVAAEKISYNIDLDWLQREAQRAGSGAADRVSVGADYLSLT